MTLIIIQNMKDKKFLVAVLIITLISLIIDLVFGFSENPIFLILILLFELPVFGLIYLAFRSKQWTLYVLAVYHFIRSFNYYFNAFQLYTKNGLNIEIRIDEIGMNIISFAVFVGLLIEIRKRIETKNSQTFLLIISSITVLLILFGTGII